MRSWIIPERLPALQGWWLKLFTVLWLALLCLAIVVAAGSAYLGYQQFAQPAFSPAGINASAFDSKV